MDLMRAFTVMLGGITAADASSRQVNGILTWRDYVYEAVKRGQEVPGADGQGTYVALVTSSETHLQWRLAAGAILEALAEQANAADAIYAQAKAAEQAAEKAAQEARDAAKAALAMAADFALIGDELTAAYYVALAATAEAEAVRCDEEAKRQAAIAAAAMMWGIAARDAIACGSALVAQENAVAFPVGEAIAAAGGVDEVYGEKRALTTDGGGGRPLAIRGGAR